jgi:hypothetical protein
MAIRILLALTAFAVLYSCGQASSLVEKLERRGGVEQEQREKEPESGETTDSDTTGNVPISGVLGENVETPSFDYRIVDVFTTDHYYYLEDPSVPLEQDVVSLAGKFVVLTYSMTNTSPQPVTVNLEGRLHVRAGHKIEVYEESDRVVHPYSGLLVGGPELAPRVVLLGQFIFDVPTDVEPELVAVLYQDEMGDPRGEAGAVKLTEEDPQGPRPEEILALQYEFGNMSEWEEAYNLFTQESKELVSLEQYRSYFEEGPPFATVAYAFPSVSIEGDRATIVRVITQQDDQGTYRDKATEEAVLEDEGWRIVMRDELLKAADWRMNETSGPMIDASARNNIGTPTDVLRTGSTYVFNGSTSRVAVPDNDSLDPAAKDITLKASVKVTGRSMNDDSYDIVRKGLSSGTPGGDYKMEITRTSDPTVGKLHCLFKGTGGTVGNVAQPDIVDGSWHTLECIKTSTSVVAKVDGRSYTQRGSAGSISNSSGVTVGAKTANPLDDVFDGEMDSVSMDIAH